MNVFGMEKFTAWFGQYLTAHYDLSACEQKAAAGTQACFNEFSPEFRAWR